MSYYIVDVESDGPIIGVHSIVCFGAVKVDDKLDKTFYGQMKPISNKWVPEALAISGFSREEHLKFPEPVNTMDGFYKWVMQTNTQGNPILVSDNNGYDAPWINNYFWLYAPQGRNPFGWSSRRIGDLYCGMVKDVKQGWKHLRKTKHTHHPVDDAKGNAEALLALRNMGLKIDLR